MTTDAFARGKALHPSSLLMLVVFLVPPFAVAALGNQWTDTGAGSWYEQLDKPSWTPPGWMFGVVWSALYFLMGVAAWLVWRASPSLQDAWLPLGAWVVQLALNLAWTFVFFEQESPAGGVVDIVLLWLAIVVTIWLFASRSAAAALLLVPYLLWVTYAAALTIQIWRLN